MCQIDPRLTGVLGLEDSVHACDQCDFPVIRIQRYAAHEPAWV
jgi:hypothetical protein